MSIVGGIGEEPDPFESVFENDRLPRPAERPRCPERRSLVSHMLGALCKPLSPLVVSGSNATFGASDGATIAWDAAARILVSANGFPHSSDTCGSGPRPDPAHAVLDAWRRFGDEFPRGLCGDFSCAVWDEGQHRLILAADVADACGLFFRHTARYVVFASDPREILSDSRIPREIDEEYMAFFLSRLPLDKGSTFFRSIGRVLPGHIAVFERGVSDRFLEPRQRKWWYPERIPALRLRSHGEYADALRTELDRAVGCCLPQNGATAISLSGGLDSTAIAALAARRLARNGQRLTACTLVFSPDAAAIQGTDWFADEFPLAARMAQAWPNIDHYLVQPDNVSFLEGIETSIALRGLPLRHAFGAAASLALVKFAAGRKISTFLSGGFGNLTASYHGFLTASALLREHRFGSLTSHLAGLRRNGAGAKAIAGRLLSPAVLRSVHRLMRKADPTLFDFSPIHTGLARSTGVFDLVRASAVSGPEAHGRFPLNAILNGHRAGYAREAFLRRFHHEGVSPAGDRRVFELCLSIPEEQFEWEGRPRALIRTAMKGLVPDAILNEPRRGEQGRGWETRFQANLPEIMSEVEAIAASPLSHHYLDVPRLRTLCQRWVAAPPAPGTHNQEYRNVLVRGVSVGAFLRRFESGSLLAGSCTREIPATERIAKAST
jgi:asparagine synthase (glutamine-hydrolysing)